MYKKIASIYDTFLWPQFSQDLFRRLEIFLYKWRINTHLDLACGTGDFVYLMKKIGINSSGSDVSREMILKARKNFPGINFKVADMRSFKTNKEFDLITSNFDSFNHLLKFSEWESSFKNVYNSLDVGGRFLFDINTLYTVRNYNRQFEVEIDNTRMNIKINSAKNDILVFDISSTNKLLKNRIREIVKETSFEYFKIKKSLLDLGFKKVFIFNSDLGFSDSKKRKHILAIK